MEIKQLHIGYLLLFLMITPSSCNQKKVVIADSSADIEVKTNKNHLSPPLSLPKFRLSERHGKGFSVLSFRCFDCPKDTKIRGMIDVLLGVLIGKMGVNRAKL